MMPRPRGVPWSLPCGEACQVSDASCQVNAFELRLNATRFHGSGRSCRLDICRCRVNARSRPRSACRGRSNVDVAPPLARSFRTSACSFRRSQSSRRGGNDSRLANHHRVHVNSGSFRIDDVPSRANIGSCRPSWTRCLRNTRGRRQKTRCFPVSKWRSRIDTHRCHVGVQFFRGNVGRRRSNESRCVRDRLTRSGDN